MTKVYACLTGNWVCLNDDPNCTIDNRGQSPITWWKENSGIYAPLERENPDTFANLNYVHIYYNSKDYRINPIFIQVVTD